MVMTNQTWTEWGAGKSNCGDFCQHHWCLPNIYLKKQKHTTLWCNPPSSAEDVRIWEDRILLPWPDFPSVALEYKSELRPNHKCLQTLSLKSILKAVIYSVLPDAPLLTLDLQFHCAQCVFCFTRYTVFRPIWTTGGHINQVVQFRWKHLMNYVKSREIYSTRQHDVPPETRDNVEARDKGWGKRGGGIERLDRPELKMTFI